MFSVSDRICRDSRGFSLIEVVLVVLIMGILSAVAAQKWSGAMEQTRFEATRQEMDRLAGAIVGNADLTANGVRSDFGYVGDVGALPPSLDALVSNPGGLATWNGPYIQSDFTQNPNDFKQDAWGVGYNYANVTITSTGSGGTVTKQFAGATSDLTGNSVVGSVTDGLNNAPGDSAISVTVSITYPNGSGSMTTNTMNPSSGGSYSFSGVVPVGNHEISAIYQSDTLTRYVSVLPKATAYVNFRLPGDLWTPAGGGGGGGGSGLTYVGGSAAPGGGNNRNLSFDVENNSGGDITVTSIRATYSASIYYSSIYIDGAQVWTGESPRGSSGETKTFSGVVISDGSTVTVRYDSFRTCVSGGCGWGDVSGGGFTIDFSDGSSMGFTVP